MTDAAVLSLTKRGQECLLDEARMVTCGVSPLLSTRRRRCKLSFFKLVIKTCH